MGTSGAMVAAEPKPGREFTITPSATPTKRNTRVIGCNDTEKPKARLENAFMQVANPRAAWPCVRFRARKVCAAG